MKYSNYARLLSMHWDVKYLLPTCSDIFRALLIARKNCHFDTLSFLLICTYIYIYILYVYVYLLNKSIYAIKKEEQSKPKQAKKTSNPY